jgi:hypothetical protein
MPVLFKNNVTAALAASISSSTTTIVVASGQGSRFPSVPSGSYFYATLYDAGNNIEIVKVTNRATDTLTVVRGQDGTSSRAYAAGDSIAMRIVAAAMADLLSFTPSGTLSATTLSGAISELDSEKVGLATNNSFTGTNTFTQSVALSGGATGNLTGNVTGNVTGNADTATRLTSAVFPTNGGTGRSTLSLNALLSGNEGYPVNQISAGAAGNILASATFGTAVVTGSIAVGTLAVTAVTSGTLTEGATISGTGITVGTTITQLTSSAAVTANPTFSSGGALGQPTLVVSSASGLVAGQLVIGTGVPANTFLQAINGTLITLTRNLTVQAAGTYSFYTPGGVGTYTTTPSQTVSATTITATNGTSWQSVAPPSVRSSVAFFGPAAWTGSISGTTLTVTSMFYGVINFGNPVNGAGITGGPTILAFGTAGTTGTGGTGTYALSVSQGTLSSFPMNNGTGSGIFVVPALVASLKATMSGGGGGGGGTNYPGYGGATAGTAGGPTSLGALMTCTGGGGGAVGNYPTSGANGATGKSPQAVYAISPNFINTDGSGGNYGLNGNGGYTTYGCCAAYSGGSGGKSITSIASINLPAAGTSITVTVGGNGVGGTNSAYGSPGTAGGPGFCLLEW